MSAYIVDPRTIDYLVQWARQDCDASVRLPYGVDYTAELWYESVSGFRLYLRWLTPNELGRILLAENVRSVRHRYPSASPDSLPGPNDKTLVWDYTYRAVPPHAMNPAWVVRSCDCLDYQSSDPDDWEQTLAYAIVQAIRESAIHALLGAAPWGVTDDDLSPAKVTP